MKSLKERTSSVLAASFRRAVRVGWVGTLTGFLLAAVGQMVILSTTHSTQWEPSLGHRLVGTVLLSAAYGGALFVVTALVLLLMRGRHDSVTITLVSALGALLVLGHALGVALFLGTGSHLTLTGLQYFLNSGTHIANEVAHRYLVHLIGILLLGVGIGVVFSRGVRWAFRTGQKPLAPRELVGAALLFVSACGFWLAPLPQAFALGVKQTVPELAFAESMSSERSRASDFGADQSALLARALDAPPQSRAVNWQSVAASTGLRPNVILITVEAINVHHLGFEGYPRETTPNLDRLAAEGMYAEHAYTTATHSNYAQMAILSSLFPRRGSSLDMYMHLDYPRVLLHDAMFQIGYSTATISSQDESWQGMKRFQDTGTPTYFFHSPDDKGPHLDIGTEEVVPDEVTIDRVLAFIDAQRSAQKKPLSIYVNLQSTHFPYAIPESAPRPFKPFEPTGTFTYVNYGEADKERVINRYDNALHYIDSQVGRLSDGLAVRGMLDDTLLVFVADHGEMFREHDLVTHARSLYESEARVPIVFHWPLGLEPGVVETPVSTLDILPTILDLMELPPHPAMQGESMLAERLSDPKAGPAVDPNHAAVFMNIQGWKHLEAVVCFPYKVIYDPDADTSQLFDLWHDPDELKDLSLEAVDVSQSLLMLLHTQIRAQLEFHEGASHLSRTHFAPRLQKCPLLPLPKAPASN